MENSFNKIKIGVVGLGQRGRGLLETLLAIQENRVVEIPDFTRGRWASREPKDVISFDK